MDIKIKIEVVNLDGYKKLLNSAEKQIKQLKKTCQEIETFKFKVQAVDQKNLELNSLENQTKS